MRLILMYRGREPPEDEILPMEEEVTVRPALFPSQPAWAGFPKKLQAAAEEMGDKYRKGAHPSRAGKKGLRHENLTRAAAGHPDCDGSVRRKPVPPALLPARPHP